MSSRKPTATAIADVEKGVVLARIDIDASPQRVFQALTTDELTQWWGSPEMYRTTKYSIELRKGGAWRTDGLGNDGVPFHVAGEVLEVEAPHRLTYTWKPSWETSDPSTVSYKLEAIGDMTRVTVRHWGFSDPASCGDHANGWERVGSWLAGYCNPKPAHYLVRLIPPRPTFMLDMSADERKVMMDHVGYWKEKLAEGTAIAFGPVADPKGAWGVGIIKAKDEAAVRSFEAKDPVIASERGFRYEILPMANAMY